MRHLLGMKVQLAPLLALLLACDFTTAPGASQSLESRPSEVGTVDHALCLLGYTSVPLRRTSATGHPLVEARLNGRDGLFVLDTGANLSVIDDGHAAEFGLSLEGATRGGGVSMGGAVAAQRVRIESLTLAGVPVRQRRMVIADLGQLSEFMRPLAGGVVHGLIGQDVLIEHRAVIDVRRPMLYLIEEDRDPAPLPAEQCRGAAAAAD